MKYIKQVDIDGLNGTIMELPSFRNLKSTENIKEVMDIFLNQIYIDQPQELLDTFDFKLNKKLKETFFLNFGIAENYSDKIKGHLKTDTAINLEKLFQQKGSKNIFKIFSDIFENVFKRLNFYNIRIHKKLLPGDNFEFSYKLEPLYLNEPSSLITEPEIPVEKTRKYIMELIDFKDFTVWPMTTDLVYLQIATGIDKINNFDVFLDGIRAYVTTLLQGNFFQYRCKSGIIEQIEGSDLELLTTYFQIEAIKKKNPQWDFTTLDITNTFLPYFDGTNQWRVSREEYLDSLQELILDYSEASYNKQEDMENLRRRWQMFLRKQEKNNKEYNGIDELRQVISSKYPNLFIDYTEAINNDDPNNDENILDIYSKLYGMFLNEILYLKQQDDPNTLPNYYWDWATLYTDVVFGNLFMSRDFIEEFMDPVMELFMKYFFPVEMDFLDNLLFHVKIKDKWNAVPTGARHFNLIDITLFDLQTPTRGLDRVVVTVTPQKWHSYIDKVDKFTVSDL